MESGQPGSFRATALVVLGFGVAMGYLEAVVVVYLRAALGLVEMPAVPVLEPTGFETYAAMEVVRELATLVMIAAVGWLAGRGWVERLAWAAVVFGTWDIVYYAGLWVTIGWPPALDTWDLLFLLPAPWVGPVWAPMVVSVALVGFGTVAAARLRSGRPIRVGRVTAIVALAGGLLVVLSFLADAARVLDGDSGPWSAWPWFWLGLGLATAAGLRALLGPRATHDHAPWP